MKRRLSPDKLRDIFTKCTAKDATWQEVDLLKDHVDALEEEIAASRRAYGHLVANHPDSRRDQLPVMTELTWNGVPVPMAKP